MYIADKNLEHAFISINSQLDLKGVDTPSRNGICKELIGATVRIDNPLDNLIFAESRKDYFLHKIYEACWVLAGRDDVKGLEKYLPRAKDYSDDGLVWRGAYGPRMTKWHKPDKDIDWDSVDQVQECIDLLKKDPHSRRAIISLLDPARDFEDTKDVPCNNTVQFLIRDNKLNLVVCQRSSDLLFGFSSINVFEWAALMMFVRDRLNSNRVQIGPMHYHFGSLHLYEPHWKKAEKVMRELGDRVFDKVTSAREQMTEAMEFLLDEYTPAEICDCMDKMTNAQDVERLMPDLHEGTKEVLQEAYGAWHGKGKQPYTMEIYNRLKVRNEAK